MNAFRRVLIGLGGIAALALVLTLATPRTLRGVAAALVQVTNTAAAPAITQNVSQLASQKVWMTIGFNGYGHDFTRNRMFQHFPDGSIGGWYTVPAGQNFVVTQVVVNPDPSYSTSNIEVILDRDGNTSGSYGYWMVSPAAMTEINPTSMVIGPGLAPVIGVKARDDKGFNVGIMVEGYLTAN